MVAPRRAGQRFWYPITQHSLARVLKFRNFQRHMANAPAGGTVLDYGSGDRPYEEFLRLRFERYVAADYDVTNKVHARRPDVYLKHNMVDLPSGSVTCVVLTEVLEHIYEPRAALAECQRLLRPGGCLVGSVPFARGEHGQPHDYYRYTSFALRRLFTESGFEVIDVAYVGDLSAVAASTFADTLGVSTHALRRVGLGWLGQLLSLVWRIPEFVYLALHGTALDPQQIGYLRQYPLGFSFLARKPGASD